MWATRSLLERGHSVVALDVGGDGHRLPLALDEGQRAAVVHVQGDITDLDALERVLAEHEITKVIHLAALQVPFVRADPALGARVNVARHGQRAGGGAPPCEGIGPVVYASSIAAYGAGGDAGGGDQPGTLYGVYKRDNEGTALRYFEDYGVASIGLRPHTVYGPGRDQGLTSAPTVAMVAAAAGRAYRIPFGGSVQLQYTPDIGAAFARAAELDYEGASVHDVGGPVVAMADLAAMIDGELISAADDPLPFPSGVDGSSFEALVGGDVFRPVADGVADAMERFRSLLAEGLVHAPD